MDGIFWILYFSRHGFLEASSLYCGFALAYIFHRKRKVRGGKALNKISASFFSTLDSYSQPDCFTLSVSRISVHSCRSIIMAFSLMLVITGPSANIAYNYRQMSTSLTCGDELGFNVTQGLRPLVHDGKNAILSTMEDTIDAIIEAVEERY